jgi:DNA-binding response OmpR family regulator
LSEEGGQEVLVVDGDEDIRQGLRAMLTELRLQPTVVGDLERARALCSEKYFAAAIIDLDTPRASAALPLVAWLHKEAPGTTVVVLTARKVFEAAVDAFRAGAADVIVKAPSEIPYLKKRVSAACAQVRLLASNERLLHDVHGLHEEFLRRLMDTSRRAAELEERLGGGAHSADADEATRVLTVEPPDDPWLSDALWRRLGPQAGYTLHRATTGGEALDVGAARSFHIALVRDALPDLPGTMVVATLRRQRPDTITILYSRPAIEPGRADIVDDARAIPLCEELTDAGQLIARLDELRRAFVAKSRERRYLASFRQQNYELLRRFADLKQKLKLATGE